MKEPIIPLDDIFNIQSLKTWPSEVLDFLNQNQEVFVGWQCSCCSTSYSSVYDQVIYQFRDILRKYSLIGYHCTKLCSHEIDEIHRNGMSLQNLKTLSKRIDKLHELDLISFEVAEKLKNRNQADEEHRAKMLWFCFFKPFIAEKHGIYRFFDSWGGEALYNSHEYDGITGPVLRRIGTPCIIKAKVPMRKLSESFLPDTNMFRVFLEEHGHTLENPTEHEGFSIENIPSENILQIIEYPSEKFVELTKCNEWYSYIE